MHVRAGEDDILGSDDMESDDEGNIPVNGHHQAYDGYGAPPAPENWGRGPAPGARVSARA